ncbi:hypothetical protein [Siphonobacter sp. SORGH_AS_0500]|uniref:hypothetical protein n=1 Tax=Siphonobacter sp. SORGH_AS_0500 TaxID=1864824 RepID=UPI00285D1390|nr:hypothetical protein [Siphonobacter sp. SORGH_AS_0500]MDR6196175.1 hypothetical protein [Siphonobacter sp. SORGH_AS_0500]
MKLGFLDKYSDNTKTRFPEKIWAGIPRGEAKMNFGIYVPNLRTQFPPKIHTLREDREQLWQSGKEITCVLHKGKPNEYEFAKLVCRSIQNVEIIPFGLNRMPEVYVDGRLLSDAETEAFIKNDGFDSVLQFRLWFSSNWTGRLIHWTDKRY